jgi:hypothetical protein
MHSEIHTLINSIINKEKIALAVEGACYCTNLQEVR